MHIPLRRSKRRHAALVLLALGGGFVGAPTRAEEPGSPASQAVEPRVSSQGRLFSCEFKDAPLGDVLQGLAMTCGVSILAGDLQGQYPVTVFLQEVNLEQALTALLHGRGLTYIQDTPTLYRIIPAPKEEKLPFLLQYDEGRLTLAAREVDLLLLLSEVGKITQTNIVAAQGVTGEVTLALCGLPLEDTLRALCLQGGYELKTDIPDLYQIVPALPPPDPEPLQVRFEEGRLSVDVADVPLLKLLAAISQASGTNVIPARGITGSVTVNFTHLDFLEALEAICLQCGYYVHDKKSFILISPEKPTPEPPSAPPPQPAPSSPPPAPEPEVIEVASAGEGLRIKARNADLGKVLAAVADRTGTNIVPSFGTKATVTLSLSGVSVEDALNAICGYSGHHWHKRGNIYIVSQEERKAIPEVLFAEGRVSLNVRDVDVQDVLLAIAERTGINIAAAQEVQGLVTLVLTEVPVEEALATIADAGELELNITPDGVYRFAKASVQRPRGRGYFEVIARNSRGEMIGQRRVHSSQPGAGGESAYPTTTGTAPALGREGAERGGKGREGDRGGVRTPPGPASGGAPVVVPGPSSAAEEPPATSPGTTPQGQESSSETETDDADNNEPQPPGPLWQDLQRTGRAKGPHRSQEYQVASAVPVVATEARGEGKIQNREGKIQNREGKIQNREGKIHSPPSPLHSPLSPLPESEQEPLITLDAVAADMGEVLEEIVRQSGAEIVFYGNVQEAVTAQVQDVPLEEVLHLITRGTKYGLNRDPTGRYLIGDATLQEANANVAARALTRTEVIPLQYALAKELIETLSVIVPQAQYKVHKDLNMVSVTADEDLLERIRQEIQALDVPTPQVKIAVTVVELSGSDATALGFSSLFDGDHFSADFPAGQFLLRTPGSFGEGIDLIFKALVEKGQAEIIANPQVVVVSGHEATIDISQTQYFKVFGFPTLGGTQQGGTLAFEDLRPIEAGVKLELTPTVTAAGDIWLEVQPEVSSISGVTAEGLPEISRRTAQTTLRVKDGQTILIGGLKRKEETHNVKKVPILGDLPILGELFKSRSKSLRETELVITITCNLLGEDQTLGRLWDGTDTGPRMTEPKMRR